MPARRKSPTPRKKLALWKWWCLWASTFVGGGLAGMGVFLVVQIQLIWDIRERVHEFGGLKRWIGKMTFLWRDFDQKLALTLDELPPEYLDHSHTAGWTVFWIGIGGFAVLVPGVLSLNWRARR